MPDNTFTLNGRAVSYEPGQTILEAAEAEGVRIPTLCYLKGATPTGACRICLVEVEGARALLASCATPVVSGMIVETDSPRVVKARRLNIELLLASGNHNCLATQLDPHRWTDFQITASERENGDQRCPAWGDCRLQDLAIEYGVRTDRFSPRTDHPPVEDVNPLIVRDFSRCILCGRCVQACNDIQVNLAISHGYRGSDAKIVTSGDRPLAESDCVFCGVNPLRGQNNVQGACDMGALPNVFAGYQAVGDPSHRAKFEKAWGVTDLPPRPGLMIPQMMEGLTTGAVKGFYIFGENLANTEPDIRKVEEELSSAEFLVCQDIFQNETTRFARVVLPAAAWSENDGTFTNSERRVSRVRTACEPPGEAKPNWWIFKQIAARFGHDWTSNSAREIWDREVAQQVPAYGGITYDRLEGDGLQWPCPDASHPGTCVLHKDGQFTCGLGVFTPVDWTPPAEVPCDEYPLVLSTGRRLTHYHTRTQTGRCEGLNDILGEETADISPEEAARLKIHHGETVRVVSRRGRVEVRAKVTSQVPRGMVWMAFHFRNACANWLTNPAYDPVTLTAEYKACAVRVEKV